MERHKAGTVKEAAERLWDAGCALNARGLLDDELANKLKRLIKKAGKIREGDSAASSRVIGQCRRLVKKLERLEAAAAARSPAPSGGNHKARLGRLRKEKAITTISSNAAHGPGAHSSSVGTVVGFRQTPKNIMQARVRAALIQPILSGAQTAVECAANWTALLTGEDPPNPMYSALPVPEGAADMVDRITPRNLQRWAKKVRDQWEEENDLDLHSSRSTDVLTNRKPAGWSSSRRIRDSIRKEVYRLFLDEDNPMEASQIHTYLTILCGEKISLRTVQRLVAQIPDKIRAERRGGPAAVDVLFRAKLLRETRNPNDVWMIDHSWVGQFHEGQEASHFDFELEAAYNKEGLPAKSRAGVHMTAVIDACTRLVLAVRLWPNVPRARDVLTVLFDAGCRYGLPTTIYNDNGADFRSVQVATALQEAGVEQVYSRPYSPEGRGKVERLFKTIKSKVLPMIPGYHGNGGRRAHEDELLPLKEVEAIVIGGVEMLINREVHSGTGQVPREHYDSTVGIRASATDPVRLVSLLYHRDGVVKNTTGVRLENSRYWGPCLGGVLNRRKLRLYFDPFDRDRVHAALKDADGKFRYLGPLQRYDGDHPPPATPEVRQRESKWESWIRGEREARKQKLLEKRAETEAEEEAEVLLGTTAVGHSGSISTGGASTTDTTRERPMSVEGPQDSDDDLTTYNPFAS